MNASKWLLSLASCATIATFAPPASGFGPIPIVEPYYATCWLERIQYGGGKYVSSGKCQEINKRGNNYPVNVPWSAVGAYDPTTRQAHEILIIVHGGLDIPTHNFYGTIDTTMVCGQDPWLFSVQDCGVVKVTTTETIPDDWADTLERNRRRPFTSDLTPQQRATLQREVHEHDVYHAAENAPAHNSIDIARLRSGPASTNPTPTTTMSYQQPRVDNHAAIQPQPIDIMEPAPGSQQVRGNVRVRVHGGSAAANPNEAMIVELSALPPRPTQPGSPPSPPAQGSKTTQVSLAQLQQGVMLPSDVTGAWTGPTLIRVRAAQSSTWSNAVSFDLVAGSSTVSARPALPAWSTLQSTPQSSAGRPVAVTPPNTQSPASSLVPRSSLGGGH